jgi:hypothetical protein
MPSWVNCPLQRGANLHRRLPSPEPQRPQAKARQKGDRVLNGKPDRLIWEVMEYRSEFPDHFRLDAGGLDHLALKAPRPLRFGRVDPIAKRAVLGKGNVSLIRSDPHALLRQPSDRAGMIGCTGVAL